MQAMTGQPTPAPTTPPATQTTKTRNKKTLTATRTASTATLSQLPCHALTGNDRSASQLLSEELLAQDAGVVGVALLRVGSFG
eukprot:352312-Chlamydomonas_euryale.AAC.12